MFLRIDGLSHAGNIAFLGVALVTSFVLSILGSGEIIPILWIAWSNYSVFIVQNSVLNLKTTTACSTSISVSLAKGESAFDFANVHISMKHIHGL